MSEDLQFEQLAGMAEPQAGPALSRFKSRVFSLLNQLQAGEGPLLDLTTCKGQGGELCVFEELVRIAPVGKEMKSLNYCRVCHARVLAETIEGAPIYWGGCPYVKFQNR